MTNNPWPDDFDLAFRSLERKGMLEQFVRPSGETAWRVTEKGLKALERGEIGPPVMDA